MVDATGNVSFNDFGYYNETNDHLPTTFTTILIVLKYKKIHINILKSVSLVGGRSCPQPGEISLAHNGVLFLDELLEF
jgi:hypothetical protein